MKAADQPTTINTTGHPRRRIGVVAGWQTYTGTMDSFLGYVYRGIRAAAAAEDCDLLMAGGVGSPRALDLGRPAWPLVSPDVDFVPVGPWNCDGLILLPPFARGGMHYFQSLLAQGYPLVFAGSSGLHPAVVPDNEGGIRQALDHLRASGHRRIAFVAGRAQRDQGDSGHRLRAYRRYVRGHTLATDPTLVAYGYHTYSGGRQAIAQILESGVSFSAVLASNDESALGVLDELQERGTRVPEDVAVVGFDDRPEAKAQVPALTTVHYPIFEVGYQAVLLLLRYLEGEVTEPETVRIPTRLVVRESSGDTSSGSTASAPGAPDVPPVEDIDADELPAMMCEAMKYEVKYLSFSEVAELSRGLYAAFRRTLTTGERRHFHGQLREIVKHAASRHDDIYAWQRALSIIHHHVPALLSDPSVHLSYPQVEKLLQQAQVTIGQRARQEQTQRILRQAQIADHLGQMTTRFFVAHDESVLWQILEEQVPATGIAYAKVFFLLPEEDDPVAWSEQQLAGDAPLRVRQGPPAREGAEPAHERRFPSREFPPPGLYPPGERLNLMLLPLIVEGQERGYVAFEAGNLDPCADIVRHLAAALRSVWLYRQALEGRRMAEEANRLKGRFLSIVSHELRTPLNLITGLSDLLLHEGTASAVEAKSAGMTGAPSMLQVKREDVERIYASAQHLDGLISDVLDLARSEVGELRLRAEPLDLHDVLVPVAKIGSRLAEEHDLGWHTEIAPNLPAIRGDRTRLRQVVLNLVHNAVKFTQQGKVVLRAYRENGHVTVEVQDTGLGVRPEEQDVIFDEFRRSGQVTAAPSRPYPARSYGGLGLGLAICKRLIEMHDGEIGVISSGEQASGSTFYFTLPTLEAPESAELFGASEAIPTADVPLAAAQEHGADAACPLPRQQVFVLTRTAEAPPNLLSHLERRGVGVETLQVTKEAAWLPWLKAGTPDAVLLDLNLASRQGWEILQALKEQPATREIPVLFFTSEGQQAAVLQMDYLTKPIGTAELAEALDGRGLSSGENAAGKRVLIVDDEPGVLDMHSRMIAAHLPHAEVLRARNGREALDRVRHLHPDLILLDLMMPEMDGFAVLKAMREDVISRDIPVIVLTGQALTNEDMQRLNQGVVSVLGKGLFSVAETLEHVDAVLERRRQAGNHHQQLIMRAMAYIHTHYDTAISRSDIADHVGLSNRHLTRCFREVLAITPIAYLNRYRVRRAKALLDLSDKGITEIALEVGFSSASYFSRVFHEEVGVSPSAYRQGELAG